MDKTATQDKLVNAFFELYRENPIEGINIKAITDLAGYHRSTFYEYFTDIYDLLKKEEDQIIRRMETSVIEPITSGELNPLSTASMLSPIAGLYETNGEKIAILIGSNGDPMFRERMAGCMKEGLKFALKAMPSGYQVDYLIEFLSSGMLSVVNKAYADRNMEIADLISLVHTTVSQMVAGFIKHSDAPDDNCETANPTAPDRADA